MGSACSGRFVEVPGLLLGANVSYCASGGFTPTQMIALSGTCFARRGWVGALILTEKFSKKKVAWSGGVGLVP